jgi:uncharacterized protein (DUF433 family)
MKPEQSLYKERIIADPQIMVGKPVVKGTRIPVQRVIDHLAHNPDLNDLFAAYPELTVEDVKACLQYAGAALARRPPRPPVREVPRAAQPL